MSSPYRAKGDLVHFNTVAAGQPITPRQADRNLTLAVKAVGSQVSVKI